MDYGYYCLLGMYEIIGSSYTKDNFVLARTEKRKHGSLDGLEGRIEEWTGIPIA